MKLLIVEDERLTREGIRGAISWEQLGITDVREAFDGRHALSIAETFQPEIVLTDIRMPRMDGVELATELRKIVPDCKLIFMSGYADKSYLKAAITLKALQYVEKPIEIEEIAEAVGCAVALRLEERQHQETATIVKETIDASSPLVKQQVALQLIGETSDEALLRRRLELAGFSLPTPVDGVTVLLKIIDSEPNQEATAAIVSEVIRQFPFPFLFTPKNELYYIVHLFDDGQHQLQPSLLESVCQSLASALSRHYKRYSITAGEIVGRLAAVKQSYTSAVVRMQEAFYRPPCTVVTDDSPSAPFHDEDRRRPIIELHEALQYERFEEAHKIIERLTISLRECPSELVSAAKDVYYRIMLELETFASSRGIALFPSAAGENSPHALVHHCHYLDDVQEEVRLKLHELRKAVAERGKGGTASRIMKYIHQHYANDNLSVGEIGEFLQMTSSHLIVVFKESTGKTVKQYLTEYRIGRAKQLLVQDRLKMIDIAAQTGFKDGEYFATLFRKHTGMSPSEYRERYRL